MNRKLARLGFLALPVLAASLALFAACSSDDETSGGTTTPEAGGFDAPSNPDTSMPDKDSGNGNDGSMMNMDGGLDAMDAADSEPPLPDLCTIYPDDPADAMPAEGPRKMYELIAVRTLLKTLDSCEISDNFPDLEDPPPSQITCFGKQLASFAGCLKGGTKINYPAENDENGYPCVNTAGNGDTVQLGWRNPQNGTYTVKDIDFYIALVRNAAISAGWKTADADRLKALLDANKYKVASDAGDGGNFSDNTCPPP